MSNFIVNTDIPNIRVVIREGDAYNVKIVNGTQTTLRTGSYISISDLALFATSASRAETASYAKTIDRNISGSVIVTGSVTVTDNLSVQGIISAEQLLVSSSIIYASGSTKFGDSPDDTHQFTGSVLVDGPISASSGITGSFKGDGSQLTGLVTDLRISGSTGTGVIELKTEDLLITGSKGISVDVTNNTVTIDVPTGLTASLYGTASVAAGIHIVSAGIYLTGSDSFIVPTPSGGFSYITTASYALTASYIENNTWNNLLNKPDGLVSSSVQVFYFPVQTAISSSYALTASYAMNGGGGASDWNSITGKPAGLVSSSAQATTWTVATSSVATTASFALTASYVAGAVSTWNDITGKPAGLVSSSTQINTGSFSGSFTGSLSGTATSASFATTASFVTTASFAITSSVSTTASYAANADLLDGLNSTTFATTGSNTFSGNQIITGSFSVSSTASFNGPTTITDSVMGLTNSSSLVLTSGSSINVVSPGSITGSITANALIIPTSAPASPQTGSIYFSGSFIYVYTGTQYRSASLT